MPFVVTGRHGWPIIRWVKVHVSLRHHRLLRRCSVAARYLFRVCLEIAGDYEQDGALAARGPKGPVPMTVAEISEEAALKERDCAYALGELMEIGLITLNGDCHMIPKFAEKTAKSGSAARMRRLREKRHKDALSDGDSDDDSDVMRDASHIKGSYSGGDASSTLSREGESLPSVGIIETHLPSVGAEREKRARRSEAWEFGIWFVERGKEAGLVPDHVIDIDAAARNDLDSAEALLAAYEREKCEAVALRFIAETSRRKARGDGVKRFCLSTLAEMWTHFETERPKGAKPTQDDAIEKAMSGW